MSSMPPTTSTLLSAIPKTSKSYEHADKSFLSNRVIQSVDADHHPVSRKVMANDDDDGDDDDCSPFQSSQVIEADEISLPHHASSRLRQRRAAATPDLAGASTLPAPWMMAPPLDASVSTHSAISSTLQTPTITRSIHSPTVIVETSTFPSIPLGTEANNPSIGPSTLHSGSREGYWTSTTVVDERLTGTSNGLALFQDGYESPTGDSGPSACCSAYKADNRSSSSFSLPECGSKMKQVWGLHRSKGAFRVYMEDPLPLLEFARCPLCQDMNLVGSFMRSFERKPLPLVIRACTRSKGRRRKLPYPPSMAVNRRSTLGSDDDSYLDMDPSQGVLVNMLKACMLCTTRGCEFLSVKLLRDAYILPFVAADYCEFFQSCVVINPQVGLETLFGESFDDVDST